MDLSSNELVVCVSEIKMGLFAKTALYPGTNTLLLNLISSFADADDDEKTGEKINSEIDILNENGFDEIWKQEYQKGCGWEIYTTDLSDEFNGAEFCILASMLYERLGINLIGLQLTETNSSGDETTGRKIILNPGDYVIPTRENILVMVSQDLHIKILKNILIYLIYI